LTRASAHGSFSRRFRRNADCIATAVHRHHAAVVAFICVGCAAPGVVPSTDADASGDAGVRDAGIDDGSRDADAASSCGAVAPWDLALGTWSTDFAGHGVEGWPGVAFVSDLAWHGGELYVGGFFTHAGPVSASGVAAWSPTHGWRALGGGLMDYVEHLVVADDGDVFAATSSPSPTGAPPTHAIWALHDDVWTRLAVADSAIRALAVDRDGSLLVAGVLAVRSGAATSGLARWDGTSFVNVETGRSGASAILVDDRGLCAAGADDSGVYTACRPTGDDAWAIDALPPQSDVDARVESITRDATGALVLGGTIMNGIDPHAGGVLRRDVTGWSVVGLGFEPGHIRVLRTDDGALWAVSAFDTQPPGDERGSANVMRFVDGAWRPVGSMRSGWPAAALAVGDDVFVGGRFVAIEDALDAAPTNAMGIAHWDGAAWHALDDASTAALGLVHVRDIALGPSCELVVSGDFATTGALESRFVSMLGAGGTLPLTSAPLRSSPTAVAIGPDGTVYAALDDASGLPAGLARVRDGAWERIADLRDVRAIAFAPDGTMYVGGGFDEGLLAWDGAAWTTVGAREQDAVSTLMVEDGALWIVESGAVRGARLSRWEDGAWTTAAAGLESLPSAMAWWMGSVVLAGHDVLAHESSLVRLRETWWEPLLFADRARADLADVAVLGRTLIVVGSDGPPPYGLALARWTDDGAHWHELGPFDARVHTVAVSEDAIVLGGDFETVAGVASVGLARFEAP
jgi:hypothetical protein